MPADAGTQRGEVGRGIPCFAGMVVTRWLLPVSHVGPAPQERRLTTPSCPCNAGTPAKAGGLPPLIVPRLRDGFLLSGTRCATLRTSHRCKDGRSNCHARTDAGSESEESKGSQLLHEGSCGWNLPMTYSSNVLDSSLRSEWTVGTTSCPRTRVPRGGRWGGASRRDARDGFLLSQERRWGVVVVTCRGGSRTAPTGSAMAAMNGKNFTIPLAQSCYNQPRCQLCITTRSTNCDS